MGVFGRAERAADTPTPASPAPGPSVAGGPSALLHLQRRAGNAAVNALIHRRLLRDGAAVKPADVVDGLPGEIAAALAEKTEVDTAYAIKKIAEGPDLDITDPSALLTRADDLLEITKGWFFDKAGGKQDRKVNRILGQMLTKLTLLEHSPSAGSEVVVSTVAGVRALFEIVGPLGTTQEKMLDVLDDLIPLFQRDPRGAWLCYSTLSQFGPLSHALLAAENEDPEADETHQQLLSALRGLRQAMASKDNVGVVAHRGTGPSNRTMGALIPQDDDRRLNRPAENSPDAFETAIAETSTTEEDLGLDGVECDVYLSGDGIPIVTHESNVIEQLARSLQAEVAKHGRHVDDFSAEQLKAIQRTASKGSRFMTLSQLIDLVIPAAMIYYDATGRAFRLEIEMKGTKGGHGAAGGAGDASASSGPRRPAALTTAVTKALSRCRKSLPGIPIDFVLFNGNEDDIADFDAARTRRTAISDITVGMNYKAGKPPRGVDELRYMVRDMLANPVALAAQLEHYIVTGVFGQEFAPAGLGLDAVQPSKDLEGREKGGRGEIATALTDRAAGKKVLDEVQLGELERLVATGKLDLTRFRLLTDYPKKAAYLKAVLGAALASLGDGGSAGKAGAGEKKKEEGKSGSA